MDGSKIFDHIRDIQSEIPVLLSSGYALNAQAENIMSKGCSGFIQKPFTIAEVSGKVREILIHQ
jgi:CheY-like chemotaxis protein